MDEPVLIYKSSRAAINFFYSVLFILNLLFLGLMFQGFAEKNWFYAGLGAALIIAVTLIFWRSQGEVLGYLAVYSNKIVEKKKSVKEIYFEDVIEVRYFKVKRDTQGITSYLDCLHFYLKNKDVPVEIKISKGTAMPYNMSKEMTEILTYIRANFPGIKYSKEEWQDPEKGVPLPKGGKLFVFFFILCFCLVILSFLFNESNSFFLFVMCDVLLGLFLFATGFLGLFNIKGVGKGKPTTKIKLLLSLFFLAMMTGAVFIEIGNYPYLLDVPYYLNGKYVVAKGIPQKITIDDDSDSRSFTATVTVTINGSEFEFDVLPSTSINEFKNKLITIYYLPHSKWVAKYNVK